MASSMDFIDDCFDALGDAVFSEALDISECGDANKLSLAEICDRIEVSNRVKVTWRRGNGGEEKA